MCREFHRFIVSSVYRSFVVHSIRTNAISSSSVHFFGCSFFISNELFYGIFVLCKLNAFVPMKNEMGKNNETTVVTHHTRSHVCPFFKQQKLLFVFFLFLVDVYLVRSKWQNYFSFFSLFLSSFRFPHFEMTLRMQFSLPISIK